MSACDVGELDRMIAAGAVGAGMLPKMIAVRDALTDGVAAAHIVDGRLPHSVLMELFTEAGIGTMVTR